MHVNRGADNPASNGVKGPFIQNLCVLCDLCGETNHGRLDRRAALVPIGGLFVGVGGAQDRKFIEGTSRQL